MEYSTHQNGGSTATEPPPYFQSNGNNVLQIPPHFIAQAIPIQNYAVGGGGGRFGAYYYRKTSIALGVVFLVCGIGSIASEILAIVAGSVWSVIGTGIWCGVIFVITGSLAISAGRHLVDSMIITTTVFSFISIAFGIIQLILSIIGLLFDLYDDGYYWWAYAAVFVADGTLLCLGFVVVVIGLWLGIVNSKAICCSPSTNQILCIPMPYNEQNHAIIHVDPRQQQMQVLYGAVKM